MEDEYAECQKVHSHLGGKADGCPEFKSGSSDRFKCSICSCDMMYHRKVVYSKCLKIHDFKIPNSFDGCQHFCPKIYNKSLCNACDCHRNFHQREVAKEVASTASGREMPYGIKKEPLN
ncbi:hypothetical protein ACP275_10G127600 [Erythranthe tilingii]